jgi:benzoate/toluate 1,2-dioxygenase subunit beta
MNIATTPPQSLTERVSDFVHLEAQLLDELRYKDWLTLFDPTEGRLWIPGRANSTDPTKQVSIIYDTTERLEPRIARLASGNELAEQPASKMLRSITNLRVWAESEDLIRAEAIVVIYQARDVNMPMLTLPSRTRYQLKPVDPAPDLGNRFRIIEKRVDLLEVHRYFDNLAFLL